MALCDWTSADTRVEAAGCGDHGSHGDEDCPEQDNLIYVNGYLNAVSPAMVIVMAVEQWQKLR